jgi:hypothetical protein
MGVEGAEGFLATGGSIRIGFECEARGGGTDLDWGAIMRGREVGLYSQSREPGPILFIDQAGVLGTARDGPGVVGSTSTSHGVLGQFGDSGGTPPPAGVCGSSQQGFGVVGVSSQLGGVFGRSDKFAGVFGSSNRSVGVGGRSDRSHGILGLSFAPIVPGTNIADAPAGVYGQSLAGSFGVLGVGLNSTAVAGIAVREALAGYFQGNIVVTGKISAGVKDGIVPFPDGSKRLLHCMESPEHWFEDFGSARLTRGHVTVKLDADFASVVKLNGYRVFLTPEGDCQGLYVRSKRGTSFEVRELQGGTSNIAFSYRIVAKRKDIKAHRRFAKIETTVPMPTGKARAARGRQAARLPFSMRALVAATRKVRGAPGRKAARLPSSIRALLAAREKRARARHVGSLRSGR